MAQPGNFTPILLYGSSTPTNVPLAANLTNSATGSEIAINVADKNLFFKDSGGVVNTVPIRQSSTSSNGWLSNTDWNTFNSKAPATSGTSLLYGNGSGGFSNVTIGSGISFAGGTLSATGSGGTVTSVAALTIGTTGTDLSSTVANGTTTPVITLQVPTASATNRGALSAADWSTFNGKQAALVSGTNIKTVGGVTLLGSGDVGTIGTGYGGTGLTSFISGGLVYATSSSALNTSASLVFTSGNLSVTGNGEVLKLNYASDGGANVIAWKNSSGTTLWDIGGGNTLAQDELAFRRQGTPVLYMFASRGVSIGNTTDPGATNLSVTGDIHSNSKISIGTAFNGTTGQFATDGTNTYLDYAGTLNIRTAAASVNRMTISSTGTVTMSAYGAGAATFSAAGVISSVSDETWKIKDGVPVNPDEMLQKLNPGYWFYNEEKAPIFGEDRQLGFYAQNVNAAIGFEAAPVPEEGKPWGYYDRSVLAVTVMSLKNALNTIKELNAKFDAYVASHP